MVDVNIYQPQLVSLPNFWLPSTVVSKSYITPKGASWKKTPMHRLVCYKILTVHHVSVDVSWFSYLKCSVLLSKGQFPYSMGAESLLHCNHTYGPIDTYSLQNLCTSQIYMYKWLYMYVCTWYIYTYIYVHPVYKIQYSILYLYLQVTCDQTSNLETQENLKAPSSCCCTGCANKPGSCIRGWYLSRQRSKEKLSTLEASACQLPKTAIQKAKAAGAIAAKKMVVASAAAWFQPWAKLTNQPRRSEKNRTSSPIWAVFLSSLQWILLRLQTYPCGSFLFQTNNKYNNTKIIMETLCIYKKSRAFWPEFKHIHESTDKSEFNLRSINICKSLCICKYVYISIL